MRGRSSGWLGIKGIAAVEFALIAPFIVTLLLGTVEMLTLYRCDAKLNAVAANVAQMVAIEATPLGSSSPASTNNATSLKDICQGAVAGLAPFPPTGLTISISSVTLETAATTTPATAATYDQWEADSTASPGVACSTTAGTVYGFSNAVTAATTPGTGASGGLVEKPCDNAIIVKVSLQYPGLTGLFLTSKPTLTQTGYARWRYAAPTQELTCPTCSVSNVATPVCIQQNTNSG